MQFIAIIIVLVHRASTPFWWIKIGVHSCLNRESFIIIRIIIHEERHLLAQAAVLLVIIDLSSNAAALRTREAMRWQRVASM